MAFFHVVLSSHCFSSSCSSADEVSCVNLCTVLLVVDNYPNTHTHTHTQSYTSTLPGATVSFSTTDRNGHKEVGVGVVRGNGDSPLQLPFVLFGLGETPNFIESLTIGVGYTFPPGNVSIWRKSYKVWSLLVPNSQVIVLIQHPDDSGR